MADVMDAGAIEAVAALPAPEIAPLVDEETKEDKDAALAPSSKHGDEGIQEGVAISEAYEEEIEHQSSDSDDVSGLSNLGYLVI